MKNTILAWANSMLAMLGMLCAIDTVRAVAFDPMPSKMVRRRQHGVCAGLDRTVCS